MIRWFMDAERRYGKTSWPLTSEYLPDRGLSVSYPHRKVWREGLEVAMKVKGSQDRVGWNGSKWIIHLRPSVPPLKCMRTIMRLTVLP